MQRSYINMRRKPRICTGHTKPRGLRAYFSFLPSILILADLRHLRVPSPFTLIPVPCFILPEDLPRVEKSISSASVEDFRVHFLPRSFPLSSRPDNVEVYRLWHNGESSRRTLNAFEKAKL